MRSTVLVGKERKRFDLRSLSLSVGVWMRVDVFFLVLGLTLLLSEKPFGGVWARQGHLERSYDSIVLIGRGPAAGRGVSRWVTVGCLVTMRSFRLQLRGREECPVNRTPADGWMDGCGFRTLKGFGYDTNRSELLIYTTL